MISYISKVLYVLGEGKKGLLGLLLVFSLSSVLEALGIGLIGPFISLASQPESIHKNSLLTWLYVFFKLDSDEQMILILGAIVIVVFIVKSLIYLFSKFYIYQYSNHQKALLGTRLLSTYLDIDYTFHLNKNTASLINNIIMETGNFNHLCLMPFLDGVANVIIILVLLILLAKTNLLFLVMLMAVLLPFFILFNLLGKHFKKWGMIVSESQKGIIRTINNGLGGLKKLKSLAVNHTLSKI